MSVACVQCGTQCEYAGPYPEMLAVCSACKQRNQEQRVAKGEDPTYAVGELIPGSRLRAEDYGTRPPTWRCQCGKIVQFPRSVVESLRKRTCGDCKWRKCAICDEVVLTGVELKDRLVCLTCTAEFLHAAHEQAARTASAPFSPSWGHAGGDSPAVGSD